MMKVNSKADAADVTPVKSSDTNEAKPTDPQHISKEDRDTFIARFKELDTNKSGALEEDEYQNAAVSKQISFGDASQLVTKDKYLTQSDFVVARGQYEHAKRGGESAGHAHHGHHAHQPPQSSAPKAPTEAPAKPQTEGAAKLQGDTPSAHAAGHAHGSTPAARPGDIPVYSPNASGHIGPAHGRTLNTQELDSIGRTLGLPSAKDLVPSLDANKAYNPRQTDAQKLAGAYLALSTAAKFETMPPSRFADQKTAAVTYGALKIKAMEGDAAGVRDILKANGGNPGDLSDAQLTNLWSGNEHQNLHGVMFGNPRIYNAIHATSLNDNDKTRSGVRMGGFNDRGEHPQWGWFDDAQTFNQRLLGAS